MSNQPSPTDPQARALDCWVHGLAHLIDAYGVDEAVRIAGCGVLAVLDHRVDLGIEAAGREPDTTIRPDALDRHHAVS